MNSEKFVSSGEHSPESTTSDFEKVATTASESVTVAPETVSPSENVAVTAAAAAATAATTSPSRKVGWASLFRFSQRQHLWVLLPAILASCLVGLTSPVQSYLIGHSFNHFTDFGGNKIGSARFVHDVRQSVIYFTILGAVGWFLYFVEFGLWSVFGDLQARSARMRIFDSLLRKGTAWYDLNTDGASSLVIRVQTQINELQRAMSLPVGIVVRNTVEAIGSFVLAASISWKLTLVTISPIPLSITALMIFSSRVHVHLARQSERLAEASKWVISSFTHIEAVKCFNGQHQVATRYAAVIDKAANAFVRSISWNATQSGVMRFIALGTFVIGFWYGGVLVHRHELNAGEVLTTFYSAYTFSKMCMLILPQMMVLDQGKQAASSLKKLEDDQSCLDKSPESPLMAPDYCTGQVEYQDVSFSFPRRPEQLSLDNVSISVPAGKTVFLIGTSGSGKSTIAQLLLGFYQTYSGTILIDGCDLRQLDPAWIRQHITVVEQQSVLFAGSIEQNIKMGRPDVEDVSHDDVLLATEFASLRETIANLPHGIETDVGERGNGVSGGQKQRIALARARIRDSPILLLDESTSALDYKNRTKVMEAIRKWRQNKTTIVITHDMTQLKSDDYVYLLDQGAVVDEGPWELVGGTGSANGKWRPLSTLSIPAIKPEDNLESEFENLDEDDISSLPFPPPIHPPLMRTASPRHSWHASRSQTRESRHEHSLKRKPVSAQLPLHPHRLTVDMSDLRFSLTQCLAQFDENTRGRPLARLDIGPFAHLASRPESMVRPLEPPIEEPSPVKARLSRQISMISPLTKVSQRQSRVEKLPTPSPADDPEDPEKLAPAKSLISILATVWPNLTAGQRIHLIIAVVAATIHAACTPVFAYIFSLLIETYYLPTRRSAAVYSFAILGIVAVDAVTSYILQAGFQSSGQRWVFSVRTRALARVLGQPREFFDNPRNSVSRLAETMDNHAENMQNILGRFIGYVHIAAVMILTALTWCLIISWRLTLVALGATPVVYMIMVLFERVLGYFDLRVNNASEAVGAQLDETVGNIRTVRALCLESHFRQKYLARTVDTFACGLRRAVGGGIFSGLSNASFAFFIALVYYYAAEVTKSDRGNVKSIIQVINVLILTLSNLYLVTALLPQMAGSKDAATRLLNLANLPTHSHEDEGNRSISSIGDLSIDHLSFSYPSRPSQEVITDASFSITQGTCVAIVGMSGSGKSTIASLLMRLYAFPRRSVYVGDDDLQDISTRSLRQKVAIVSQTPALFPMSIAENITYGLEPGSKMASLERVRAAARAAGIDEFVTTLPEGYGTIIGDGGTGLSGGQAQRISIARALVRKPDVLILDEATSALDPETAGQIRDTIQSLLHRNRSGDGGIDTLSSASWSSREKESLTLSDGDDVNGSHWGRAPTVIIITHAREMMALADKVVMLDHGAVVQVGTYPDLKSQDGPFRSLLKGEY